MSNTETLTNAAIVKREYKRAIAEKIIKKATESFETKEGWTMKGTTKEMAVQTKLPCYVVSITNFEVSPERLYEIDAIADMAVDYLDSKIVYGFENVVGFWYDEENDVYCLDLGFMSNSLVTAVAIGVKHDQKSIWDLSKMEAISLTDLTDTAKRTFEIPKFMYTIIFNDDIEPISFNTFTPMVEFMKKRIDFCVRHEAMGMVYGLDGKLMDTYYTIDRNGAISVRKFETE